MKTRMSAAKWGELVAAWELSGLSAETFASEQGILPTTLKWWKTELGRRARNEVRRRPPHRQSKAGGVPLAKVVRPASRAIATSRPGAIAVVVGQARVVVEDGFDRRLLREVVRVLEEAQ